MEKTAEAFRTISEVADWLELPTHRLRFWKASSAKLNVKRAGGRRYYRPKDMLLIGGIKKLLHEDGENIKAAKKFLTRGEICCRIVRDTVQIGRSGGCP